MSAAILTVPEVFSYVARLIQEGVTVPEGYILTVRLPPGYGPPDDILVTVEAFHPAGGLTFSTTVMRPPHTVESVDATIGYLIAEMRRRVNAGSN